MTDMSFVRERMNEEKMKTEDLFYKSFSFKIIIHIKGKNVTSIIIFLKYYKLLYNINDVI